MDIKLNQLVCRELGVKVLKNYGLEKWGTDWKPYETVDLADHPLEQVKKLRALLVPFSSNPKAKIDGAIKTIDLWAQALTKGADTIKARTVEKFTDLLIHYLLNAPGHCIFERDTKNDVNLCYYVGEVNYLPKEVHEHSTTPPRCQLTMYYREFGGATGLYRVVLSGSLRGTHSKRGPLS